ncbi:AMP-binding protein [Nocardia huaxiensis]|uniref:AMP-binding protein n=1 Tax=Nocardia huaxiensis TaxID=2755382 RepID=A0A7D6VAT2_9NOCA|nr:AMP-binding protein [Nocardia huaxiensis]QLY30653.1 AMP-binding protein [Nocardia huaxiensis]UFS95742.1 AMP-binding protein [Nocardia huaxiensis]
MVTQVIDASAEFPIARKALWDVLVEPQNYTRLFPGIGAVDEVNTVEEHPTLNLRIGGNGIEIRTLVVQLRLGRDQDSFEIHCPFTRSFAAVRLRGDGSRTRVNVTYFAAGLVHPLVEQLPNSAVVTWTVAGLRRAADLVLDSPTSLIVNGEDSMVKLQAGVAKQMVFSGVVRTYRPDVGLKQLGSIAKWGFSLAGGYAAAAAHSPDRPAVIDDRYASTFAQLHERTNALAGALTTLGFGAGTGIGLLCRNHTGMVECMVAAGKSGADSILLNTGLPARQIEEIAERHRISALFVDSEFEPLVRYLPPTLPRFLTDDLRQRQGLTTLEDLIAMRTSPPRKPPRPGRLIVLTSGTSGTPKGAKRPHPKGFGTVAALLSRIPFGVNETMLIPSPLFHTWGLAALQISTAIRATVVLSDRFDAEDCLRQIAEHKVTALIVVPVMVNRILDLPTHVRARYDLSSLKIVASCGAPLAGSVVVRFLDTFGDILYNVYGSTEVSWASIADPQDLRLSPTTAGRPPLGTKIGVLGQDRRPVPVGTVGRIFVGNHMLFDGYTDATPPDEANGMLDTGDIGYLDASGKLFVAGRDDEMIISGGENVFPRAVEEALSHLPQVSEVAVVGVPDHEFGQRLAAFVVKRPGSGLDSEMVRNYIRHRVSRFSVPRDVTFLDALPRNATGKILKRTLVQPI